MQYNTGCRFLGEFNAFEIVERDKTTYYIMFYSLITGDHLSLIHI